MCNFMVHACINATIFIEYSGNTCGETGNARQRTPQPFVYLHLLEPGDARKRVISIVCILGCLYHPFWLVEWIDSP